ncbi:MAG: PadR family transcriptional regulator, partial [Prevotella sp.]|nr:PadR family transcriptional regulator [Prevotella sp.]
ENEKSQMRKGMLEYCVLLLLKHRPSYASDIIQQLNAAELLVVEGTLYPLLTRLKNDGQLCYEWQESTQGPPRKYYALSPEGEKFLEGLDTAWTELSNTVGCLKNLEFRIKNYEKEYHHQPLRPPLPD